MTNHSTPPDNPLSCSFVRAELACLLYDELDATERTSIEQHLESCAECRAEFANHQSTGRLLDEWDVTTDLSTLPELTLTVPDLSAMTSATNAAIPSLLSRWRPLFIGAAAALIIFACLTVLSTNVQIHQGQVILTIGNQTPDPQTNEWAGDPKLVISDLQALARAETDDRIDSLLDSLEGYLAEFRQEEEVRRRTLIRAVDLQRDEDRREQSALMQAIAQLIHDQSYRTQDALDEIRTQFARQPQASTTDTADDADSNPALDIESEQDLH